MKKFAIIVAGGKGLRMGYDLPKQFIPVAGKPILMYTIEAFYNSDNDTHIIVVLHKEMISYWNDLCEKYSFLVPHSIAQGGETRFHSVKNGLALVESNSLVAVHDGVRPFISSSLIQNLFNKAEIKGAVIPVTDMVDSVRKVNSAGESKIADRSEFKLVQTPQIFKSDLLLEAYHQEFNPLFTDDSSVVEANGQKIYLVKGERSNIKITTPFDLKLAEAFCRNV